MESLWEYPATTAGLDLRGFEVLADDAALGRVEDAAYEEGASYIVVEVEDRLVLVPAGAIAEIDDRQARIHLARGASEVAAAPAYEPGREADDDYRTTVADYFGVDVAFASGSPPYRALTDST